MKYKVKELDGWTYGQNFLPYGEEVELTDEQFKRYETAGVKLEKPESGDQSVKDNTVIAKAKKENGSNV